MFVNRAPNRQRTRRNGLHRIFTGGHVQQGSHLRRLGSIRPARLVQHFLQRAARHGAHGRGDGSFHQGRFTQHYVAAPSFWQHLDGGFGAADIPTPLDSIADLPLIGGALRERGYSEADVTGIMGGNWVSLLRRTLA